MNPTDRAGDRADRLARAHADLVTAVESLISGQDWQRMLKLALRFHRYSSNNVLLILLQRPDATRVAGYRAWKAIGRQVRKGERGIRILAPCDSHAKVTDEEAEATCTGFRGFTTATVFDVGQTEGEDLPDVQPILLEGDDVQGLWDLLALQVQMAGYTVDRGECDGANGRTDHSKRSIRVRDDVSDAQAIKTLCHELAHVMLHPDTAEYSQCRGRSEVEAESVAYLICQGAGLRTDEYSWPYIAHWSGGDAKVVQGSAGRVLEAARTILTGLGNRSSDANGFLG